MAHLPKGKGVIPLPPFQAWLASNIPAVYDNTMTYYEELCALLKYLQDQVVPALNDNAEAITVLSNYVEHYFDNLDVQEEINNKLDEMAADGTLEEIISHYIDDNFVTNEDYATAETGGVVKVGDTLKISENGVLDENDFDNYIPATFNTVRYHGTGGYTTIHYVLIDKEYKPKLALANDTLNTDEWAGDNAAKHKSTFTVNAGLWNMETHIIRGPIIIDGEILKENTDSPNSREILYMTADGTLNSASDTNSAQDLLNLGAVWATEAWYPFIKDGIDLTGGRDPSDYQPRSVIGQDAEGNYLVMVTGGRSYDDVGVSAVDCVNFCSSIGFTPVFLYNLDGGGSTSFIRHGIRMNNLVEGEHRKCSNFIYWTSDTAKDNGTFEAVNGQYHRGAETMRESVPYNASTSYQKVDAVSSTTGTRVYIYGNIVILHLTFTTTESIAGYQAVFTGLPKASVADISITAHLKGSAHTIRDLYITNAGEIRVAGHNTLEAGTYYANMVYSMTNGKNLDGVVE